MVQQRGSHRLKLNGRLEVHKTNCFASTTLKGCLCYVSLPEDHMVKGKPQIHLIFAKSRISPKKPLSIPILKIMALLIGVHSFKFVSKKVDIEDTMKII